MDNEIRKIVQKNLKKYREEKGFTQTDLAIKIGSNKTTVASWEQGKSVPSIDMAYRIMNIYGLSINLLFKEEGDN